MDARYSRDELLEFLDFLAEKGLMKRATASSRKAASNVLLSILSEEEAVDLRGLDVDDLMMRFANLRQGDFKPDSLSVYKSRLNGALQDFFRWRDNPMTFKPSIAFKDKPSRASTALVTTERKAPTTDKRSLPNPNVPTGFAAIDEVAMITFPIPLRPGVIVKVVGIPNDLSPEEAEKIGKVVLALSGSQES